MYPIEYYINRLLAYCQQENFAGYDPYDGLNSRLFQKTPLYKSKIFRLCLIQGMKRLPINIRPLLLVPKNQNPKALALFLMAFIKLRKTGFWDNDELIDLMIQRLINLRSPIDLICDPKQIDEIDQIDQADQMTETNLRPSTYYCWGYSFPWQTRTILVPRGYPNLVCTVFVANALLDAYEMGRRPLLLAMAISAAEYILNELYWEEDSVAGFSYPLPGLKNKVHNANFLGAAFLSRVYALSGEDKFFSPALKAARYSASKQNHDGSWYYGEGLTQRWIDNFHTGYNLCALKDISRYAQTGEFEPNIRKGFEYYKANFFDQGCVPKYFHDRTYPIDIHSVAQSLITLLEFDEESKSNNKQGAKILHWAISNMWDKRGYFYYQMHPRYIIKIPYMRWSEAWMILALALLLAKKNPFPAISPG